MNATLHRQPALGDTEPTPTTPAAPAPMRPRLRAFEVPTPRDADEARAALAERTLTGIEGTRAEVESSGDRDKIHRLTTARNAWEQKKAECEMLLTRFERGETAESIELAEARERVAVLEERIRDQQELAIRERIAATKGREELVRALAARDAEVERLKARLDAGLVPDDGARAKGAAAVFHDFCALSLAALEEIEGNGTPLPMLARALRHRAGGRVSQAYIARWRAEELPLTRRFAEVREAREAREASERAA